MHALRSQDRNRSMTALVSFHGVPMPRGLAFVIRDIETDGAPVAIFSADRTVGAIRQHNSQFKTSLSAQQALVDAYRAGRGNPANPANRTSHCYYADDTIAALLNSVSNGLEQLAAGGRLPWWALGLDVADKGKVENVSHFMAVAKRLGYAFRQPYSSGRERHHVILVRSPVGVLEKRDQIARDRHD